MDRDETPWGLGELLGGFLSGGFFLAAFAGWWLDGNPAMLALLVLSAVLFFDEAFPYGSQPHQANEFIGFVAGAVVCLVSYLGGYFLYFLAASCFLVTAKYSYRFVMRRQSQREAEDETGSDAETQAGSGTEGEPEGDAGSGTGNEPGSEPGKTGQDATQNE